MKSFNRCLFFGLSCLLFVFDSALCTESIYEQISPYMHDEDSHYVDPDSLYYNRHSQRVRPPKNTHSFAHSNEVAIRSNDNSECYSNRDNSYEVFARRLINILVTKSRCKISDGVALGQIDIVATVDELNILKRFGDGKLNIRQIDGVINNVIQQNQASYFDDALDFTERVSIYIFEHRISFGSLLLVLFVILISYKVKWTRLRVIFLIVDIMVIISFMLTWWELLQESEINLATKQKMYGTMPTDCSLDQISFFRSIVLFFGWDKNNCIKHYEAIMTDPVLKVTPMHAFSHMCSKFIVPPLTTAGSALSLFIENITEPLPPGLKQIVRVLLVLSLPILIAILAFVYLGGAMGVRVGPFFHLYLHGKQATPPSNCLASGDRQAVEIVRSDIAERVSVSTADSQQSVPVKKKTPEKTKVTVQKCCQKCSPQKFTEKQGQKIEKQEESDTNSEEFPEEKEYEKISRRRLEDEMSQSSEVNEGKNKSLKKEKEEVVAKPEVKNKNSLDIGSGDS